MSNTITLIITDEEPNSQSQTNESSNTDEEPNSQSQTNESSNTDEETNTGTLVPNTGNNTHGGGLFANSSFSHSFGAILIIVASVTLLSMLISNLYRRRNSSKNLSYSNNGFSLNHISKARTLLVLPSLIILAVGGYMLSMSSDPSTVFADDATLPITPADTTLTITRKKDQVPTFAIASTTIKLDSATTNGYKLFISALEGNSLKREEDTASENNIIPTITLNNSQATSTLSLNSFAVTTTNNSTATSSVWSPFPTKNNKSLIYESNSATNKNSTVTIYYGFYISSNLPAGTYTGKVGYEAEAKVVNYTCTKQYRLQNADGTYPSSYTSDGTQSIASGGTCSYSKALDGYMTKASSVTMTGNQTINLDLPRNTYTLTINKDSSISSVSGAGTYRWGQSVNISASPANGAKFIKWTQTGGTNGTFSDINSVSATFTMGKGAATINAEGEIICAGYVTMQGLNSSNVATLLPNVGSTAIVCDSRDESKYTIGKLEGNKVWMLDNLALDLVASKNSLNSNNTNASDATLGYLKGTTARNPDTDPNGRYATAGVSNWTSSSYSVPLIDMSEKDVVPSDAISQAGGYKIGGYYNFCAASAGSYCYGNDKNVGSQTGDATEDICPKGWRIPTRSFTNETVPYTQDDATAISSYRSMLHLPNSGVRVNGGYSDIDASSYVWTSSSFEDNGVTIGHMYSLEEWHEKFIGVNINSGRNQGNSIRCVLSL